MLFGCAVLLAGEALAQTRIMPLGNSITDGDGSSHQGGYRYYLYQKLANDKISFDFVGSLQGGSGFPDTDHEGHGGFRTTDLQVESYLAQNPAEMVLLEIGTNDISLGRSPQQVANSIASLLDRIHAQVPVVKIFLSTTLPRRDHLDAETDQLNELLPDIVASRNAPDFQVFLVNINARFKEFGNWQDNLMADDKHPNDQGYELMAEEWYRAIKGYFVEGISEFTDGFSRFELGSDWTANSAFRIQDDQLINTSHDDTWDYFLAVCNALVNPTVVEFSYGALSDLVGRSFTGMALMLNRADASASGYLIFHNYDRLRMWMIEDGVVTKQIAEAQGFANPRVGDVLRAEISSDAQGHHFTILQNGEPMAVLNDPLKRYNGPFCGIMINGNTSNGVEYFYCANTHDTQAPGRVTDLRVSSTSYSTVVLQWTAPGNDGDLGRAAHYDIRYSTSNILSDADFNNATQVTEVIPPSVAGTTEHLTVGGLESNTTYYFAMRTSDEAGHVSGLSNEASGTTVALVSYKDTFNRSNGDLGSDWGGDLTNLQIRNNTAQNIATAELWSVAVLKKCKNTVDVTVKYGPNATTQGISGSGILLMADGPTSTTNGYLIQRYNGAVIGDPSGNRTRLWLVRFGRLERIIEEGASQCPTPPRAGSRINVQIVYQNNIRYFYVYVDGVFDRVLSDPARLQNGLYAGFMLQGALGEKNALDEFNAAAAPGGAKSLSKVSGDNQVGAINQTLPAPLKVALIDSFDNPMIGAFVKFTVTAGTAKITLPPSPDGNIRLEAEETQFNAPLEIRNDAEASGGKYIVYPIGQTRDASAVFSFEIKQSGTYYIWTRSLKPTLPAGSWDIRINNSTPFIYDVFKYQIRTAWTWDLISERGNGTAAAPQFNPRTFNFTTGSYQITFGVRYEDLRLDKILITADPGYIPSGKEETGFVTDTQGLASASVVLGDKAGGVTIQASYGKLQPVTFTATASGGKATKITMNAGNGQSGPAGQVLQPFKVMVQDDKGNGAPGELVSWVVTTGNGTLSEYTSFSDVSGIAATTLTLGNNSPTNTVEARIGLTGSPIVFTATTTAGIAANLATTGGNGQSATVHTALPAPLVAKVTTSTGQPVPNFPVDFRIIRGGGSLSPDLAIKNDGFESASPGTNLPLNWTLEGSPAGSEVTLSTASPHSGTKCLQVNSGSAGVGVSQILNYPAAGSYTLIFYAKVLSGIGRVVWILNDAAGNQVEKLIDLTALATGPSWMPYVITANNGAATPRSLFFKTAGSASNFLIDDVKIYRNTDSNGEVRVNWTLGDTAMTQVVRAEAKAGSTNLTGSPLTFSATANPAAAKRQVIHSGNNQIGSAGQLLAAPLITKIVDEYGNGIAGRTVKFTVTKGGGKLNGNLTSATLQTNTAGTAQVTLTLGPVAGDTNIVQVTSTGLNAVTFSAVSAVPGKVTKVSAPTVGSASVVLSKPLVVKVTDPNGRKIAGYPVIFQIKQGNGKLNKDSTRVTVPTDTSGQASVFLTLGPAPGAVNRVEAYVMYNGQKLPNPVLTFTVNAAPLKELVMVGGNNQAGPACEPLAQPFKVKVADSLAVGIRGQFVIFVVTKGGGKLGNLDSMKVTTDSLGFAQTKLTLGSKPGTNQVIAKTATSLLGSPMTFTATGRIGAAAILSKVSGDSLFSLINTVLKAPQVVRVTDKCGNVIAGTEVKFKVKAGGGKVNDKDSVIVLTDANGKAQATWRLGAVSGVFNNQLEVRAFNGTAPLANSPMLFVASATPNAARSMKATGTTSLSGQAGMTLATSLVIKVTDGSAGAGNGVPGHSVRFVVTKGGGMFSTGRNDTTVTTDQLGVAQVKWTLGGVIGTNSQEVTATATNGGAPLEGSPVKFVASVIPGPPSAEGSEVVATSPIPADGATKSQVKVYVRDRFGNPLSGKAVTLNISPVGSYFIDQPTRLTNSQGLVTGAFASKSAGKKTVTAKVLDTGTDLTNGATVEVTPLSASQMFLDSGHNQTCNTQAAVVKPLRVKVADVNGNGVPNHEVKFSVVSGGGRIYEPAPIITDADGFASATFIGGTGIGQSQIWAESKGLARSPIIFLANVVISVARNLQEVSGNAQKAQVGQMLPQPLVVRVTDKDGRPVYGIAVRFDVTFGGGTLSDRTSLLIDTNEFGEARVNWRLGPSAGPQTVRVSSSGLTGSPIDFRAEAVSGRAEKMVIYSGQYGSGDVGGNSPPVCVRVMDNSGNGVDGVEVLFELVRGTGSLSSSAAVPVLQTTTREGGFACATVTFDQYTGWRQVRATSSGLRGSPVTFYVYGRALAAQTMKMIERTNNQRGTKGKQLNFPLQVFVQDRLGNPVPNFKVDFVIAAGGGTFNNLNPYSTTTDTTGIASAAWTLGPYATNHEARAVGSGNVQPREIIFTATGFDNNFPIFEDVPDRQVIKGDVIEFSVLATDSDGDPLTYGAKNLPPYAQFDSLRSRVFRWNTSQNVPRQYAISFIVRDNKGGSDEELVLIDVKNRNHTPIILSRYPVGLGIPTQRDTVIDFNTTLLMWVNASDADNDPLNYRWFLNGKYAGSAAKTYLFRQPATGERFNNVEVLVFDQEDTVSTSWLIQVPVKLTSFSATLDRSGPSGGEVVKLEWRTAWEANNAGFNVLRSRSSTGQYEKINRQLIAVRQDGQYVFIDDKVEVGGRYYYKLEDLDHNGNTAVHGPLAIEVTAPKEYVLQQNYPNPFGRLPFNPTTQIRYELPKAGHVTLAIYNALGQEVRRLVDREQPAGYHLVVWNGRDQHGKLVPSGIYHYRLHAGDFVATKKMLMAK